MTTNTTTTPPPPLRKPRHSDGRLMTDDDIRGLDGDALRQLVGVCVMGWRWAVTESMKRASLQPPPRDDDGDGWHPCNVPAMYEPHTELPSGIKPFKDWHSGGIYEVRGRGTKYGCPNWTGDIAAAFEVDRPEWRWEMEDYDQNHFDVAVYAIGPDGTQAAVYEQNLDRKATPQDYARARCVAALLLAAKIGE